MASDNASDYVLIARRLINEHADLFDALLEYERTKKMPRLSRKKRIDATVDTNLLREFRREAEKRGVTMSGVVERALAEQLRVWRKK